MLNASLALLSSAQFPRLLALILDIGNYLNAGTRSGGAKGFRLASLLALKDTRSANEDKISLLDYLVEVECTLYKFPSHHEMRQHHAPLTFIYFIFIKPNSIIFSFLLLFPLLPLLRRSARRFRISSIGRRPMGLPRIFSVQRGERA